MHVVLVGTVGAKALKWEWAKVGVGEGRSVQVVGTTGFGHIESGCWRGKMGF